MKRIVLVMAMLSLTACAAGPASNDDSRSVQPTSSQNEAVKFDSKLFSKKFVGNPPNGDKLIEFVQESESFDDWTYLIGFRYQQLPKINNDPRLAAISMARIVKASNPDANSSVIVDKNNTSAIVDFLTWPKSVEYLEFNVFRYIKSRDDSGVISVQFARRFDFEDKPSVEEFKALRSSWLQQAVDFDMSQASAFVDKE